MLRKATINLSQKRNSRHPQLLHASQSKSQSSSSPETLLHLTRNHLQNVQQQVQTNRTLLLVNNFSSFSPLPMTLQQQHKQKIKLSNDVNHSNYSSIVCRSNHHRYYTCLNITPTNCTSSTIHSVNNNHLQKCLFSTGNKTNGEKDGSTVRENSSSSEAKNNGNGNTNAKGDKSVGDLDESFYGLGRARGLIGLGIITTGIISLPIVTR